MNWYLLNLPLAAALATAVVAPILVVMSHEAGLREQSPAAPGAKLDLVMAPAAVTTLATTNPGDNAAARQPERVLAGGL